LRLPWTTQRDPVSKRNDGWAQWLKPIILATGRQRLGRSQFKIKPDKKVHETPSHQLLHAVAHACHPAPWGRANRRTWV
jgi:hypothetical protein